MDRRGFVQTSLATGASVLVGAAATAGPTTPRVRRVGLIGCGWYGMVDLRHLIREGGDQVEVVALCDVDSNHLRQSAEEVERRTKRRPQTFSDFRTMLKPGNLDIVLVATPDHWHPMTAIAAMQAGADLYCEKPICHTYLEGQAMLQTARKHERVVQVNTQRRSTPHIAQARNFLKDGNLGRVGVIRAYCYVSMRGNENPPDEAPPKQLDWDFWQGPAPERPYNRLIHPKGWRRFNEYSNGILGDMGIHMSDVVRWFTDLRMPRRISSTGGVFVQRGGRPNITDTQTVTYDYPECTVIWEHRTWSRPEEPGAEWGVNFYGERGTLQVTLERWRFEPSGKTGKPVLERAVTAKSEDEALEPTHIVPGGRGHMQNFLECVRARRRPIADIEEGFMSSALCVLGNLSQRVGRSITWDADKERVVGDEEANRLLRREYRKPWVYPTGG